MKDPDRSEAFRASYFQEAVKKKVWSIVSFDCVKGMSSNTLFPDRNQAFTDVCLRS